MFGKDERLFFLCAYIKELKKTYNESMIALNLVGLWVTSKLRKKLFNFKKKNAQAGELKVGPID